MCDRASVRAFRSAYEPPLFWSIVVFGGLGNLAVVCIYLNVRRRLKTMTDVFLLNLAVADLLFLLTLPLWAAEASGGWSFGSALCKVNSALFKVNLFSSVLLLTCISIDRYVVIVQTIKAHNSKQERRRYSALVCAVIWLLAVLLATPELIFAATVTVEEGRDYCRMVFPASVGNSTKILLLSLQVIMGFCLPLVVMIFCYSIIIATLLKSRNFQKHKAMRVILAVVVVFVLSQMPYSGVLVMEATQASNMTVTDCQEVKRFDVVGQVLKSLAYTHACINPFLYAFVGDRFRRDLFHVLRLHRCIPTPAEDQLPKQHPARASVMSETETSQALSL